MGTYNYPARELADEINALLNDLEGDFTIGELEKALGLVAVEQKRAADVCPADGGKHSWYPNKDNYLIYSCRKCGARG